MMRRLAIAEWLCGDRARRDVFEPLVADWQRELDGTSGITRWRSAARGWSAFAITMATCLISGGSAMPRVTLINGLTVLLLSTVLLIAIQIGLNVLQFRNDFPLEMRFWMALPLILPLAIPLAMLPMMMLVRSAGQLAGRGATALVLGAALVAYLTAGWLTPLIQGDVREELYEQMYLRDIANDRAGRVSYPATAVRQVRPTTAEQRAIQREQFRNDPRYLAAQAERTRARWGRSSIMLAALTLAVGAFGWLLGGLRRTTAIHAAAWWALAWITLMVLDGRFQYPGFGVSQYIGRGPDWAPLAVFGVAAIVIYAVDRRRGVKAPAPAPTP